MGRTQKQQKQSKQKTATKLSSNTDSPAELTFLEHIHELRKRLFWVVFIIIVGSAIGFQYKDFIIGAIMAPLHGEKLVYLTPGGGFSFIFTLSIYFGALLAIPFAIYHLYRFLQPMLGISSRRFVALFMLLSTLLAAAGALFGYFVTIPSALNFLATFAGDAVTPNLTADSYLNFVVTYILGLAVIFQLPLLIFLFDHIRPFPPGTLLSTQRYVIIGATVLAAIITPTPDAINMAIVGVPIVVVYQLGALAVFIRRHSTRKVKSVSSVLAVDPIDDALERAFLADATTSQTAAQPTVVVELPPQVKPQLTAAILPQPQRRSVDGFMAPAREQSQLTVPSRSISPRIPEREPGRSSKSIDGFMTVKA